MLESKSNVILGQDAADGMRRGIKIAVDAVRPSYGHKGVNVIVEDQFYPYHRVLNDAKGIIQAIQVEGEAEKVGLNIIKELMDKADKTSADGRKTTAIILDRLLEEGKDFGMSEKEELNNLISFVESELNKQKTEISESDIDKVATIAGESKEVGRLLKEIYTHIGKDGIIHLEASETPNTSYELIDGIRFTDTGYLSEYMVHDESIKEGDDRKPTEALYKNPTILVTKNKISHLNDINPLLKTLESKGKKDLVIFTDDMDSGVARVMINAHKSGVVNILIIKAPVLWKNYIFEDFARCVGATIVEDAAGINFKNLKMEHLGTCEKIVVDKEETIITGGADISGHIKSLRAEGSNDSLLRLSWLVTKTALLRLGANSESELSHMLPKTRDAINSSKLALKDGVVPGAGLALATVALKLPHNLVGDAVRKALEEPRRQLELNNGGTLEQSDEVIDACAVVKNAVRNAIGLASIILTGRVIINLPKKSPEQIAAEALQGQKLRF